MIHLLTVLNWFTTKKAYLAPYVNDESAKKAATKLWTSVDKGDIIPFAAMFIISVLICYLYYFPFNKQAGRHYHPKYWGMFFVISAVAVLGLTFALLDFSIAKNASFDSGFIFECSLINMLYGLVVFFITSFAICKSGKSNAYPIF